MYDILIIGSGPSALSALSSIDGNKYIGLIDIGTSVPKNIKKLQKQFLQLPVNLKPYFTDKFFKKNKHLLRSSLDQKKYWGSSFIYQNNSVNSPNMSNSTGGFSMIWGASSFSMPKSQLIKMDSEYKKHFLSHNSKIEKLLDVAHSGEVSKFYLSVKSVNANFQSLISDALPRNNSCTSDQLYCEILASRLAVSIKHQSPNISLTKGCIECEMCQIGCPTSFIWSSVKGINDYSIKLGVTKISGTVTKLEELSSFVKVHVKDGNRIKILKTKKILLTGGPASSVKLLVDSGIYDSLRIVDSQTTFLMFFSLAKIKKYNKLSLTDSSLITKKFNRFSHCQLYLLNDYFIARIRSMNWILKFIPEFIFEFLRKRIVFGFAYFPQEVSGQLEYSDKAWKICQPPDYKKIGFYLKDISESASKNRLIRIPIKKHLKVGGGNHLGSNIFLSGAWKNIDKKIWNLPIDEYGRPSNRQRIHLCDAAGFGPIPTGPVTVSSMAHTSLLVKKIISSKFD